MSSWEGTAAGPPPLSGSLLASWLHGMTVRKLTYEPERQVALGAKKGLCSRRDLWARNTATMSFRTTSTMYIYVHVNSRHPPPWNHCQGQRGAQKKSGCCHWHLGWFFPRILWVFTLDVRWLRRTQQLRTITSLVCEYLLKKKWERAG